MTETMTATPIKLREGRWGVRILGDESQRVATGALVAVAKALEPGSQALVCASTGNTSAWAAAYGARSGLPTYVLVPKGNIALGKLAQALAALYPPGTDERRWVEGVLARKKGLGL